MMRMESEIATAAIGNILKREPFCFGCLDQLYVVLLVDKNFFPSFFDAAEKNSFVGSKSERK